MNKKEASNFLLHASVYFVFVRFFFIRFHCTKCTRVKHSQHWVLVRVFFFLLCFGISWFHLVGTLFSRIKECEYKTVPLKSKRNKIYEKFYIKCFHVFFGCCSFWHVHVRKKCGVDDLVQEGERQRESETHTQRERERVKKKEPKTHYMMAKIHINKSNPNFNGFECACFLHEHIRLPRWESSNSVECFMSYIIPLVHFALKSCVRFCHSRDDFIQFAFLSIFCTHTHIHTSDVPTVRLLFSFFSFSYAWLYSLSFRGTQFEYFFMNLFHFSNIVIELDGTFFLTTGIGSANVSEKENAQMKKKKPHSLEISF